MLAIKQAAYAVGDNILSIKQSAGWLGLSNHQAKIYERLFGLEYFACANNISLKDLILQVTDKVVITKNIKFIIHAHTAQVVCEFGQSLIADIRHELGLEEAQYFGTSLNNCGSIFNAIDMAECLLADEPENAEVLLIVGDVTFTQSLRIVPNVSITGDAAGVFLVSKNRASHRLVSMNMDCHGEYANGMWLLPEQQLDFEKKFPALLKKCIDQALIKANITLNQLAMILPHNVNLHFWRDFAQLIHFPFDKILTTPIKKYAHCFGSDVVINWVEAQNAGLFKPGDYYLVVTAGLGVTLCAAVFQY